MDIRDRHDAEALHRAAIDRFQAGSPAAALELIDRAIRKDAGDSRAHQTRGIILSVSGAREEAMAAFREALRLDPSFADAHASLGLALLQSDDAAGAARHLERAVALRAAPEWQHNLALAQARLGRPEAALKALRSALAQKPDFAQAHGLMGSLLMQAGDAAGAETAFRAAMRSGAASAELHSNLGAALMELGRFEEAESSLRTSVRLNPHLAHAWNNLGNAVRRAGRRDESQWCFQEAIAADARFAPARVNLGNVLRESGRYDAAMESLTGALAIDASSVEAHLSKAICHLVRGDLDAGWDEYAWRVGAPPDAGIEQEFARRVGAKDEIGITGEQGLGDVLFFLRWAEPLAALGARVAFFGDERLHPLLASTGVFTRLSRSPASFNVAAGDLPRLMRGKAPANPPPLSLRPDAGLVSQMRDKLASFGPAPYIGVCWRAGVASAAGAEHLFKYVPPIELGAALRGAKATLVSLQRGVQPGEMTALNAAAGREVHDFGAINEDLPRMLALLAALDDYVGVSSTNVHLWAGLAKPARILVPLPPEWRYGAEGIHTPWFPQFTLYREDRAAGWDPALAQLTRDLDVAP